MERGLVVFGILFLLLPILLLGGVVALPAAAFALTLALVAVLAIGFLWGISLVDLG